jgi:hypothetical protein
MTLDPTHSHTVSLPSAVTAIASSRQPDFRFYSSDQLDSALSLRRRLKAAHADAAMAEAAVRSLTSRLVDVQGQLDRVTVMFDESQDRLMELEDCDAALEQAQKDLQAANMAAVTAKAAEAAAVSHCRRLEDMLLSASEASARTVTMWSRKARTLEKALADLKQDQAASAWGGCPVCMTSKVQQAVVPCGHCMCSACAAMVRSCAAPRCPVCKGCFDRVQQLFV